MTTCEPLFLSGAGLPPWIWDDVRERLGGGVVAPRPADVGASLQDHADAVRAFGTDGPEVAGT